MLSRFERRRWCAEFGSRKLLTVLTMLGMEIEFVETIAFGSLNEQAQVSGCLVTCSIINYLQNDKLCAE
jgi:hypothetical protein